MVVTLPHYRGAMKYYWLKKSIIMLLISSKDMKSHANWNVLWDCRVSVKENAIFRCIRLAKEKCQGPWKSSSMLAWVAKRIIEKLPNFSVKRPNLTSAPCVIANGSTGGRESPNDLGSLPWGLRPGPGGINHWRNGHTYHFHWYPKRIYVSFSLISVEFLASLRGYAFKTLCLFTLISFAKSI